MQRFSARTWVELTLILLVTAGWKVILLCMNAFPFNADEAVVGLMARHILAGHIPVFFYGQAYMGSLDAMLVAGLFGLVGQSVQAIRIVQIMLYLFTIITTVEVGRVGFKSLRVGLNAAWLLSIPPVNQTLYTTVSLGGYGEALLIGNLVLICGLHIYHLLEQEAVSRLLWFYLILLGVLTGLGIWANGLTLVYSGPVNLLVLYYLLRSEKRRTILLQAFLFLAGGVLLGALPWWIYAFQNGLSHLLAELLGTAVDVAQTSMVQQILNRLFNFFLLGLTAFWGIRPPWEIRWLVLPLIPFVLIFWGWVSFVSVKKIILKAKTSPVYVMLAGVIVTLFAGFVATPFGNDPSGRYFLPLSVPFALLAADAVIDMISKSWARWGLIIGLIFFNLAGTWVCALNNPPGITTQFDAISVVDHSYDAALMQFLLQEKEYYGYSNYWVAYPIAFQSQEKIIFIPRLPYHQDFRFTIRDDRYAPYREAVSNVNRVAYITTNHPELNDYLRQAFEAGGVTWREKQIGNYTVFYQLSRVIRPEDIGLGDIFGSFSG